MTRLKLEVAAYYTVSPNERKKWWRDKVKQNQGDWCKAPKMKRKRVRADTADAQAASPA